MRKPVTTFNAASAFNGVQRFEINVATLAAGTYWVELVVDDVKMTTRGIPLKYYSVFKTEWLIVFGQPLFYNFSLVASSSNSLIIVASHT